MHRAALLALFVALAGCSVGKPGSPTGSSAETAGVSPTGTVDSPTPTVDPSTIIAFEDLPDASQDAFEQTRRPNGLAKFAPESPYVVGDTFPPEAAAPFAKYEYVRKNGELFELSLEQGELYASYRIRARAGSPGPNATVVTLANVSADRRDAVRAAIENGSYSTEPGQWDSLGIDAEYVRYDGSTYRLRVAIGDYWELILRVDRI